MARKGWNKCKSAGFCVFFVGARRRKLGGKQINAYLCDLNCASMKKSVILLLAAMFAFVACSDYENVLKSTDYNVRYEAAKQYYFDGHYGQASSLFLDLIAGAKGTERAEEALYLLGMSSFKDKADALSALGIGIEFGLGDVMSGGVEAIAIGRTDIAPFAERHAAAFFAHFHGIGRRIFCAQLVGGCLPSGIRAGIGGGVFDSLGWGVGLGAVFGATVMAFAAFLLTTAVTAFALRRFGTQYFIETLLIPIERPRQTGAGHGEQQHKEVGAADGVEIQPAAMATAAQMDGELFAEAAGGARPKCHKTRDEHEEEHQRAHTHDEFAPPDAFALVRVVEQPAVEFEHHFE